MHLLGDFFTSKDTDTKDTEIQIAVKPVYI